MKKLLNFYLPTFLSICLVMTASFFWYTQKARAAVGFVQAVNCVNNGTTHCVLNITATSGNALFVAISWPNTNSSTSVSDGINTYTQIATNTETFGTSYAFYAKNITGGALTITITTAGNQSAAGLAMEFSNVDTVTALGGTAIGQITNGTSSDDVTASLSAAASSGDAVVGAAGNYYNPTWTVGATNPSGFAIPSGATANVSAVDGQGHSTGGYAILAGSYSGAVSFNAGSRNNGNVIAAVLKASTAAVATPCSGVTKAALAVCGGTLAIQGGCVVVGGTSGCGTTASAGVAFVKATDGVWQGSGTSYSMNITATSGNLLVVTEGYAGAVHTLTLSDGSNTYTQVTTAANISLSATYMWYAKNITGGSLTLSFTSDVSVEWAPIVAEFSGVDTTSPLIGTGTGSNSSSGAGQDITSSSLTAGSSAGDLLFAGASGYYKPAVGDWIVGATKPTGFAIPANGTNNSGALDSHAHVAVAYTTGAYSGAASLNPNLTTYGTILFAAFKHK